MFRNGWIPKELNASSDSEGDNEAKVDRLRTLVPCHAVLSVGFLLLAVLGASIRSEMQWYDLVSIVIFLMLGSRSAIIAIRAKRLLKEIDVRS